MTDAKMKISSKSHKNAYIKFLRSLTSNMIKFQIDKSNMANTKIENVIEIL